MYKEAELEHVCHNSKYKQLKTKLRKQYAKDEKL